jgi:hypothetical protein
VPLRSLFFIYRKEQEVELEFHQLQLRYERLKVVRPEPEKRLLASLAEVGQQVPIVVVGEVAGGWFVVIRWLQGFAPCDAWAVTPWGRVAGREKKPKP